MRPLLIVVALAAAACGASVGAQAGDDVVDPDAAVDSQDPPDAPGCQQRVLLLSVEGETLTDAPASDATQNLASCMPNGVTQATTPPYRNASANRAAEIQAIVA